MPEATTKFFIFVYGSLMKGEPSHDVIRHLKGKYIGKGRVDGFALYRVNRTYPGAIEEEGEYVLGEVYEVSESAVPCLDRFEVEGDLYFRVKVNVKLENGKIIKAYMYVYNKDKYINYFCPATKVLPEHQPWTYYPRKQRA